MTAQEILDRMKQNWPKSVHWEPLSEREQKILQIVAATIAEVVNSHRHNLLTGTTLPDPENPFSQMVDLGESVKQEPPEGGGSIRG